MPRCRARTATVLLYAFVVAAAPSCFAQNWAPSARELAEKIVARAQSRAGMALTFHNLSSLDASDAADVRRAIESRLRVLGVRLVQADQAVEDVDVTLSENAGAYVWVALVGRSDAQEVAMVSLPRPPLAKPSSALGVIRRTPLIAEPYPILDVVQASQTGVAVLLVLTSSAVRRYVFDSGGWKFDNAQAISLSAAPRDPRGRLIAQDNSFTAFLPGTQCAGQWSPSLTMTCRASDDPWPLALTPGPAVRAFFNGSRDFFAGPTSPPIAAEQAPFYSAARVTMPDHSTTWLIGALDGSTRIVAASGQLSSTVTGWGSSFAAAIGACGAYVLTSRAGSFDQPDIVRAYQLSGRKMVEVSEPLDFPGPVLELWTQPDGASLLAISKNLTTGTYEASSLTLACGR